MAMLYPCCINKMCLMNKVECAPDYILSHTLEVFQGCDNIQPGIFHVVATGSD